MYYQNLPLYLKLINLLKVLYQVTHNLPKEYKYGLAQDILSQNWKLIDLFIEAQTSGGGDQKLKTIQSFSTSFDLFKIRIRFLSELKIISLGQTSQINGMVVEIGKMAGSWLKNV